MSRTALRLARHLVRRALQLPPREALRKALGLTRRVARALARELRDAHLSTRSGNAAGPLRLELVIDWTRLEVGDDACRDLQECTEHYLRHEFDLLGSGWQQADYAAPVAGLEGISFPRDDEMQAVAAGRRAATDLVTPANRAFARTVYARIDDPRYRPIDWQRDLRSGYRWSNRTSFRRLAIGEVRGADIKLPWELARLQHLPQLALAAALAKRDRGGLRASSVYVAEIRNQCLDFIALNPPRQGACWGCPMDIGIRTANLVLTDALLDAAGLALEDGVRRLLADSVMEHARHVVAHVEWSEQGRSNHFLGDLVGLLFAAEALPASEETAAWRDYAAAWLVHETLLQFHVDGGCYEGSTSYHRLSAELVVYGLALVGRIESREPGYVRRLASRSTPPIRGGLPAGLNDPGLSARLAARVAAMHRFLAAVTRPDGTLAQIGDTDSGRLFKLLPVLAPVPAGAAGDAYLRREQPLQAGETLAALASLLGRSAGSRGPAEAIIAALVGGWRLTAETPSPPPQSGSESLEALVAGMQSLPRAARRSTRVPVPSFDPAKVQLAVFPDFGLVCARSPVLYLLLRCAPWPHPAAPTSHLHDDNLSVELHASGIALVSDPGTYAYTAFPELRNAYRRVEAHFAPRAAGWDAVRYSDYLFELRVEAGARCLHASGAGVVARLESTSAGWVQRVIRFLPGELLIEDGCAPGALREAAPAIACCEGYGIRTTRPSRTV